MNLPQQMIGHREGDHWPGSCYLVFVGCHHFSTVAGLLLIGALGEVNVPASRIHYTFTTEEFFRASQRPAHLFAVQEGYLQPVSSFKQPVPFRLHRRCGHPTWKGT